jgi:hypothetical protein
MGSIKVLHGNLIKSNWARTSKQIHNSKNILIISVSCNFVSLVILRMIQLSKENKKFDRTELCKYLDIAESPATIENATWKFVASRIGYDLGSRQAIGHFSVFVDGPGYLNWGCILVMEWGDDDVISLKTAHHTFGPGR